MAGVAAAGDQGMPLSQLQPDGPVAKCLLNSIGGMADDFFWWLDYFHCILRWWLVIYFCDKSSGGPYWTLYRWKKGDSWSHRQGVSFLMRWNCCENCEASTRSLKQFCSKQTRSDSASWKAKHAVKRSPTSFAPHRGTWRERTSLSKNWSLYFSYWMNLHVLFFKG